MAYGQPVARFTSNTISGCAPILVNFSDQSTGNPTEWKWDLGNGTVSYLQNPSVTYFNPGLYAIKLIVKTADATDSVVKINYLTVNGAPSVDFTASQNIGCNLLSVNFTDQSISNTGNISSWQWDFGDGVLSTAANPSHTYNQIGNYNVSLKASNSNGCTANILKAAYIKLNGIKAGFTNAVSHKCTPTKIIFQNTTTGNGAIQHKWFFGNGDSSTAVNPVYTYPACGNYTVKLLVSNQYGCIDSSIKNITVDAAVNASFAADITTGCKTPVAVHFTSQVLNGNTYSWSFGDSTPAAIPNPVHQFNDTGSYTVKLIIKNINGCVDSVKKTNYIKIQKPFVSFDNLPDSGCLPLNKQFSVSLTGADSIVNYQWDFGDGTISNSPTPAHSFITQGYHTISLMLQSAAGCRDTVTMANAVKVNSKPVGNFSADIRNTCARTQISFTDLSSGSATEWQWYFGDNSQSADQHPKHVFTDTGFMKVQLMVFNGGCVDTVKKEKYIYIKPAVAKFRYNFTCASPFTFSFNNFSIGAERWLWNFGDGNTSTQLNPVHTYSDTGLYTVSLTAFNQTTGCDFYQSKKTKVVKLQANFFASDTVLCKGKETRFTSTLGSNEVTRFIWDFGDGNTENTRENTVTHLYEQPGTYSLRLIIINLINCRDSIIKQGYIRVNGPTANFGTSITGTCANSAFVFSDSSLTDGINAIQKWQWNYGDGLIETLLAPPFTHVYNNRGNYIVSLKVTDMKGCADSFQLASAVNIKKLNPLFYAYDTVACTNKQVAFVAPYAEAGITYRWDFGDGGSAAIQSPKHSYLTEGRFTVKMIISHIFGCTDSSVHSSYINITNPVAKFSMSDSFRTCPPLVIQFTNNSVNAIDELWDFGDGTSTNTHSPSHFYSYPGIYIATLTVNGRGGCSSKMQKQIIVKGPKGTLSYDLLTLCKPQIVTFKAHTVDAVSYIWDFNDGTTVISSDTIISHRYSNPGKFIPKLMLADDIGCKVPVNGTDTIDIVNLSVKFNFPGNSVCGNDPVTFSNTTISSDSITNYYWNFGDSTYAGNVINPLHEYAAPGAFYPSLKVRTQSGCIDSFYSALPVKIAAVPNVSMQSVANGCAPLTETFASTVNISDVSGIRWHWDFGNGNSSVLQNPQPQIYTTAGTYTVTMIAINNAGCKKIITKNIEAYPLPALAVTGGGVICKGTNTNLVASGGDSYSWTPSAGLSCTNCASPLVSPQSTTNYLVTTVNANGCIAKDSVTVKVVLPFKMNYIKQAKLCAGESIKLSAGGAGTYEWWPKDGLSNIHSAAPVAKPENNITYRVIGTDEKGCFKDTGYVTVSVNALPLVDAGEDKKITAGSPIDLIPTVSTDAIAVNWSPTSGLFRSSGNAITVKPLVNTEYKVEVKNAAGCIASDKVNVTVINAGGDVFIPNTFSPNGDGSNDVFYPRAAGSIKINRFKIFNRAGVAVYEKINFYTNDAAGGWDGNFKGTRLASDVFVYAIEIVDADGKPSTVTGNVALLR